MALLGLSIIIGLGVIIIALSLKGLREAVLSNNELLAIDRHRPDTTEEQARLSSAITAIYLEIQELRLAVDEGIRNVRRAEKRVAKTVQTARRQLANSGLENPGLEAEAEEIRDRDGDRGDEGGVLALQPDVEEDEPIETGIPGYWGGDA